MFWRLVKTAIFTGIAPLSVGILIPAWLEDRYGTPDVIFGMPTAIAGYIFLVYGIVLYLWCAWDFVRKGKGTPAPIDAPRKLVVSGPYRYVRNPMYVAVLCMIAAQVLHYFSKAVVVYFFSIFAAFHLFVLLYEEPHLRAVFGEEYQDYCRRVSRWLPRIRPAA